MAVITYESLADVPDDLKDDAKEVDGKVQVKVALASKIVDFREKNIRLSQERDEFAGKVSRYETVTGVPLGEVEKLDDFARLLESLRETEAQVKAGKLVQDTSLEEAATARVTEVTNNFKNQMAELARDRDAHKTSAMKAKEQLDMVRVENAIRTVASDPEVGMLEGAVRLILSDAFGVFRVEENGKIVPKAADGTILYGNDGVNPMSVKEWLLKAREGNEFLFKGARGGGSSGGDQKIAGRLTTAELANMSPAARMAWFRKQQGG